MKKPLTAPLGARSSNCPIEGSFFCTNYLLTNASTCGIIEVWFNGPRTAVLARFSDRYTPYGIFSLNLATLIWPQFSRKATPQGRSGIRICPIYLYKADRLIIILSHYNYNIFFYKNQPDRFSFSRSVKMVFIFIIPKKFSFVKAAPILIDFYKKK